MNIDTTSPAYQNLLSSMITIRNQLNNNYMSILLRMTPAQLRQLYQRDELFRECVKMAMDLNDIATLKGIEL